MAGVEWGREKCLSLIKEYENMRVLWDMKHPHYYAKNKKQEAWETIASKFNIDAEDMKRKVNSLLGSFRRERSKERRNYAAGKDYVSRWFAFEKLRFLLDNREDREDANLSNAENDEDIIEISHNSPTFMPTTVIDKSVPTKICTNKRKKVDKGENPPSPQLELERYDKMHTPNTSNILDEFDAIGRNVAAKLRSMKTTQRIVAEKLIHDALFYGQLEKLNDSSNIQVEPECFCSDPSSDLQN